MGWRNTLFVLLAVLHANDTLRRRRDREGQSTQPSIPSNASSLESCSWEQELISLISRVEGILRAAFTLWHDV